MFIPSLRATTASSVVVCLHRTSIIHPTLPDRGVSWIGLALTQRLSLVPLTRRRVNRRHRIPYTPEERETSKGIS